MSLAPEFDLVCESFLKAQGGLENVSKYKIIIDGLPRPKQRPRFSSISNQVYTPAQTVKEEQRIKDFVDRWLKGREEPIKRAKGPVFLFARFCMPIAKSWPKAKKEASYGAYHIATPDFDNLLKLLCDSLFVGLSSVLVYDDSQISACYSDKVYCKLGELPRIELTIISLD